MKKASHISRTDLNLFSEHDLEFILHQEKLKDFIGSPFSMENFNNQIELKKKSFKQEKRIILAEALTHQYQKLNKNDFSLNQGQRNQEINRILVENEAMLKRLQNRTSNYNVSSW